MSTKQNIANLQQYLDLKSDFIKENADFLFNKLIISVRHKIGETDGFNENLVKELIKFGTVGRTAKPSTQKRKNFLLQLIQDDMTDNWPSEKLLLSFKEVVYVNFIYHVQYSKYT